MFYTYIIVIFTCLIVYTSFILYENYQINKIKRERRSELLLDEVGSILDRRFTNAQNIVQNLSYSTAMKQLYMFLRICCPDLFYQVYASREPFAEENVVFIFCWALWC